MRSPYSAILVLLILPALAHATTHTIGTSGFAFSPAALNISLGDTVVFSIGGTHNAVEVDQGTWTSNGNTPLSGGFSVPFGGGMVILTGVGTHYYVCSPHASLGMKGTITVTSTTIGTGTLAASSICKTTPIVVPFTASGTFNSGNIFTAQLSDAGGSFASPRSIGTLAGTTSGQISATVPAVVTAGAGYRIRVVSSSPPVTGTDNGSDLTLLDVPAATLTPGGPTAFCEGQSVQLDAPVGTGYTYTWRRDGTVIAGAAGASYTATQPGQYSVEISNGSCSATSTVVRVIVHAADPTTLVWTGNIDGDWATMGNWDNPCAVPNAGDTVTIGSGVIPPSAVPAAQLGMLTLDNVAGLTLSGDLQISGRLVLATGMITLGSANLTIGPAAVIAGGGSNAFIVSGGSGELRQAGIGSGGRSAPVLFPVGAHSGSYTPVFLQNGGVADRFGVRVENGVLDGGNPLTGNAVDRTWHVTEETAGGSNANLTFTWSAADELPAFDRGLCYVAHHDGNDWQQLQTPGAATGGGPWQRTVSGVSSFSPFAVGDGSSPLPVEYRSLSTEVHDGSVAIRWETESELNSRGFTVERGRTQEGPWSALTFVESRGTAGRPAAYEHSDTPPAAGSWWYRLRQQDMDGSETLSPALRAEIGEPVFFSPASPVIEAAWPNPLRASAGEIAVRIRVPEGGAIRLTLRNVLGQQVADLYHGAAAGQGSLTVRAGIEGLPAGLYFLRLDAGGTAAVHRLTIER